MIKKDSAVQNVIGFTGGGGATNTGMVFVILKPLGAAKGSAAEVINRLRPQLSRITGASTFLQASQDLRIGGRGANAQYQYTIQADNVSDLQTGDQAAGGNDEAARLPGRQLRPAERRPGRDADL